MPLDFMFVEAIIRHDIERVKNTLEEDTHVLEELIDGRPPIFFALTSKFWDAVCFFIDICPSCLQHQDQGNEDTRAISLPWDRPYPLHVAVEIEAPESLLRKMIHACPKSLFWKDKKGQTPLMIAAKRRNWTGCPMENNIMEDWQWIFVKKQIADVKLLVDSAPETLMVKDGQGELPLHGAAWCGVLGLVKIVASKNMAAARIKNNKGDLPIHKALFASRGGSRSVEELIGIVSFLAKAYPESLFTANDEGMIPLHVSVDSSNHVDAVRSLLSLSSFYARSSPSAASLLEGIQPNHMNAMAGFLSWFPLGFLFTRLLHSQLLMITNPKDGKAAIHYATYPRYWSNKREVHSPFAFIVGESPRSLRIRDSSGRLPLHLCRHPDWAGLILSHHPTAASEQDNYGNLPLHHTCDDQMATLLYEAYPGGLKVANDEGEMPVHTIVRNNKCFCLSILEALVRRDPKCLQQKCKRGRLPIFYALQSNSPKDILLYLLEKDPQCLDTIDCNGVTPLHHFARECKSTFLASSRLRFILESGGAANLNRTDSEGRLPLHVACSNPVMVSREIIKLLLEQYTDGANVFDGYGNLPLFYVPEYENPETLDIIIYMLVQLSPELFGTKQKEGGDRKKASNRDNTHPSRETHFAVQSNFFPASTPCGE